MISFRDLTGSLGQFGDLKPGGRNCMGFFLPPAEHFSWCAAALCFWSGKKQEEGNPYICACLLPTYQLVPVILPKTAADRTVLNDIIEGNRSII